MEPPLTRPPPAKSTPVLLCIEAGVKGHPHLEEVGWYARVLPLQQLPLGAANCGGVRFAGDELHHRWVQPSIHGNASHNVLRPLLRRAVPFSQGRFSCPWQAQARAASVPAQQGMWAAAFCLRMPSCG